MNYRSKVHDTDAGVQIRFWTLGIPPHIQETRLIYSLNAAVYSKHIHRFSKKRLRPKSLKLFHAELRCWKIDPSPCFGQFSIGKAGRSPTKWNLGKLAQDQIFISLTLYLFVLMLTKTFDYNLINPQWQSFFSIIYVYIQKLFIYI